MKLTLEREWCVRAAEWPQDEAVAAMLLQGYAEFLESGPNGSARICAAVLQDEIRCLHLRYAEPASVLLLAWNGSTAGGCVAVKRLPDRWGSYEMKRLWTQPNARRHGVGRLLVEGAIAWARAHGAEVLLLDTQPTAMPQAVALYRALGFRETARYNDNPVAGLFFMELRLR